MVLSVTTFILLFSAVATLSIGAYVFSRNPRSPTHRALFPYATPNAVSALALALLQGGRAAHPWYSSLPFATDSRWFAGTQRMSTVSPRSLGPAQP